MSTQEAQSLEEAITSTVQATSGITIQTTKTSAVTTRLIPRAKSTTSKQRELKASSSRSAASATTGFDIIGASPVNRDGVKSVTYGLTSVKPNVSYLEVRLDGINPLNIIYDRSSRSDVIQHQEKLQREMDDLKTVSLEGINYTVSRQTTIIV